MRGVFLSLRLPRPPHRRLLLGDPDQHYLPRAASGGCLVDQRTRDLFLVLTLGEMPHRNAVRGGEPMNLGNIGIADLPERCRGRDWVPALPAQELIHPAHGLQLRHIGLQEDPVDRTTGERDVVPQ